LLSATPKVASPEWSAVNLKHELVLFYADSLAQALRQEGVEVITSQDIGTLLGMERQRQLLACDDGRSCITELASALGCEGTLTVNLVRFEDGGFRGLVKVISSRDGRVLSSAKLDAGNERELLAAIERAARGLAAPLFEPPPSTPAPRSSAGPSRWWLLPAALTVGLAASGSVLFVISSGDAQRLAGTPAYPDARALATDGLLTQRYGWVSMGAALAAALATVGVLVFSSNAEAAPVALIPAPGGLFVVGAW
jgi:hypothetical protein